MKNKKIQKLNIYQLLNNQIKYNKVKNDKTRKRNKIKLN